MKYLILIIIFILLFIQYELFKIENDIEEIYEELTDDENEE